MEEKKRMNIVWSVVLVLMLISIATGLGAEFIMYAEHYKECEYPTSPAFPLGIIAAWGLATAHAIINLKAGFCCCRGGATRPLASKWFLALVPFCFSWFIFVHTFLILTTGMNPIDLYIREIITGTCYEVNPGLFRLGAVSSFFCVSLGMLYYQVLDSANSTRVIPPNQAGIEFGQRPQVPPLAA